METVGEIAEGVRRGRTSAEEVVRRTLQRIGGLNPPLNALRETLDQSALERAAAIDREVAAGRDPGLLAGVPFVAKDNIATTAGRTSCGSRMLESYRSPFTATAVERLLRAGAILIGKSNCDEFAMGSSAEHCAFGAVRNPWDRGRVPGGSSGGSAAAVAAGMVPAALGSDTGGSIRLPAAWCGVVGVKPSYGRVSRWGLVAFGSSLDQIGPITSTVEDAALLLSVMAGADRRDATCAELPVPDYGALLERPLESLRLGLPRQYAGPDNHPDVEAAVRGAAEVMERLGATIVPVDLPLTGHAISTYYILSSAEASSNLARFDSIRYGRRARDVGENLHELYGRSRSEGFGAEVKRRIMLGTYTLSAGYFDAYYRRALSVRRLIKREFDAVFARCHAILGPSAPTAAFALGARSDPLSMYLCDVYTTPGSIAGLCAISLPAGLDAGGMPIGVQIQCQAFDETTMFRVARMFQGATAHHLRRPPSAAGVTAS